MSAFPIADVIYIHVACITGRWPDTQFSPSELKTWRHYDYHWSDPIVYPYSVLSLSGLGNNKSIVIKYSIWLFDINCTIMPPPTLFINNKLKPFWFMTNCNHLYQTFQLPNTFIACRQLRLKQWLRKPDFHNTPQTNIHISAIKIQGQCLSSGWNWWTWNPHTTGVCSQSASSNLFEPRGGYYTRSRYF